MGPLQAFFCLCLLTLSAVASATSPTNTSNMAAQRNSTIDPDFEGWPKGDAPLNFALWVEEIGGLLNSIEKRLSKLGGNLDILLTYCAKDTLKNREKWRDCLESHGIGLENRFAQLRHRFFIAYAFYLARESPILEQLEEFKPRMTACESNYIEVLGRIEESLGEGILGEIGLPEKFLQSGNTIIGTWLSHLRISSKHDPASPGLSERHASKALRYLSELLYWLEVAATRKHYASKPPYGSYSEERQQAWAARDAFIARRIQITENVVRQLLRNTETVPAVCISMEMVDEYVQSFRDRAMVLGYSEEAQTIVTEIPFLKPRQLYELVGAKLSNDATKGMRTFEEYTELIDNSLTTVTVDLFILLHKRGFDKEVSGRPSPARDLFQDLNQLKASVEMLGGINVFMRALRLPDNPCAQLQDIWAMSQDRKASNGCDPGGANMTERWHHVMIGTLNILEQFGERLKDYNWPRPTTLREAVGLAQEVFLALQQSAMSKLAAVDRPAFLEVWSKSLEIFNKANLSRGVDTSQLLYIPENTPAPSPVASTNGPRQRRSKGKVQRPRSKRNQY